MSLCSIVLPSYNEEGNIHRASTVIHDILSRENINHEIIFVDDGSSDKTWYTIEKESEQTDYVVGVHFSRNFGKESAITAGLAQARGDCVVVMDCDLQHPPEKIVEMFRLWEQGYEIVEGVKNSRGKESGMYSFAAKTFYKIMSSATGIDMQSASDYKLLDRSAVRVLLNMKEKNAFFRALSSWIGFKTTSVSYDVQERESGQSKWSTKKLIKYAISNITSFSTAPMQIVTVFGGVMLIIAIVFGIMALYQKIVGIASPGFTTVIILNLFIGSIVMISLGIIGYYIAKIFEQVQDRPTYIVSKICGENDQ